MAVSLFKTSDYRAYLGSQISANADVYGYKAALALAAGCQRSYLSQVLAEKADLLPEHALGLAAFWSLSETETDYWLNLVSLARASTKTLRAFYQAKIASARRDQDNLVKRISEKTVLPEAAAAIFYSNWQYLAINILLTIPEFRTVRAISDRLDLSEAVVAKSLAQLNDLGLVSRSGAEWRPTNSTIHIPRDSQFNSLNHSHWRQRAIADSFLMAEGSVHYTSVCSLSRADAEKLKELALQLVDDSRKIVAPSREEELCCLTLDWFRV